jgi:archaellum component FlaC
MNTKENHTSGFSIFLRGLVRLILVLLVGVVIGGFFYFLGTYLYQQVVIPTQQNTYALNNLNTRIENQWGLLNDQNAVQDKRIIGIENQLIDTDKSIDELNLSFADLSEKIATFEDLQNELVKRLDKAESSITKVEKKQEVIINDQKTLQTTLENQDNEQLLNPLLLEIQTIKSLQHINRSRLYLIQNNYGLTKNELQQARYLLDTMLKIATIDQQDVILMWSARLDIAIDHLPGNPVLASEDLETIWSMLANGFTPPQPENGIMDSASVESTLQPDAIVSPELTPTPTPTVTK